MTWSPGECCTCILIGTWRNALVPNGNPPRCNLILIQQNVLFCLRVVFVVLFVLSPPRSLPCAAHICPEVSPRHSLLHCLNWWWGQLAVSPGACDCRWKTAYWSTLTADRNHHWRAVLIGLKIAMILTFDRARFVIGEGSSALLVRSRRFGFYYLYFSCLHPGHRTPRLTETPSVHTTCMRYDSEWQYSGSHIVPHPASLRVGSIWACVTHPLQHSALASVCVSCWLAGISVCQLAASRCLRHLVGSVERKSMALCWLEAPLTGINQTYTTAK